MSNQQVHFYGDVDGRASADQTEVVATGREVGAELDSLLSDVRARNAVLEECLAQVEQYQQVRK